MSRKTSGEGAHVKDEERERVRATLGRILASPGFRNSKQCQSFLQYVVEHSHAGEDERLKERTIGVELFGRAPDYDTSDDPIVRVRATEVRKRLSQYYADSAAPGDVRFEIPSGSYRAEFHAQAGEAAAPAPGSRYPWQAAALAAVVVALLAAGVFLMSRRWMETGLDRFWAPVLKSPKPALIYCGQPVVYFLSRDIHEKYGQNAPPEERRAARAVALDPAATLRGSDIIPITDQFVGIGNAHAAVLLSGMFAARGKPVEIRYANDLSFTDLRGSPSILIGAFSNLWTLEMTRRLRFVFEQDGSARRIRDRAANRTWQLPRLAPDGKTPEDYAVVTRLFDSASGQPLISAGGITQYGTRAAGEFLTDRSLLEPALAKAPPDWAKKNLQVLLHTDVYKDTPAPPRVLAVHAW